LYEARRAFSAGVLADLKQHSLRVFAQHNRRATISGTNQPNFQSPLHKQYKYTHPPASPNAQSQLKKVRKLESRNFTTSDSAVPTTKLKKSDHKRLHSPKKPISNSGKLKKSDSSEILIRVNEEEAKELAEKVRALNMSAGMSHESCSSSDSEGDDDEDEEGQEGFFSQINEDFHPDGSGGKDASDLRPLRGSGSGSGSEFVKLIDRLDGVPVDDELPYTDEGIQLVVPRTSKTRLSAPPKIASFTS
jgi:hypothetical protein